MSRGRNRRTAPVRHAPALACDISGSRQLMLSSQDPNPRCDSSNTHLNRPGRTANDRVDSDHANRPVPCQHKGIRDFPRRSVSPRNGPDPPEGRRFESGRGLHNPSPTCENADLRGVFRRRCGSGCGRHKASSRFDALTNRLSSSKVEDSIVATATSRSAASRSLRRLVGRPLLLSVPRPPRPGLPEMASR